MLLPFSSRNYSPPPLPSRNFRREVLIQPINIGHLFVTHSESPSRLENELLLGQPVLFVNQVLLAGVAVRIVFFENPLPYAFFTLILRRIDL